VGVIRYGQRSKRISKKLTAYDYGKEANKSFQTNVIYLVYADRIYPPFRPAKSDK
jgi:hypothetical protein